MRVAVFEAGGISEDKLLSLAASAERPSEHPLARAIVNAAEEKGVPLAEVSAFRATAGGGVEGQVFGDRVLVAPQSSCKNVESFPRTVPGQRTLYAGVGVDGAASISHVFVALSDNSQAHSY